MEGQKKATEEERRAGKTDVCKKNRTIGTADHPIFVKIRQIYEFIQNISSQLPLFFVE